MRIDIYSDTVCPWCFLGKRRLELAVASRPQYDTQVRWRPFEINPEVPVDGVPRASYLASRGMTAERAAEADGELVRLGAASGIQFRFDLIQRIPNTRWSHLLLAYAGRNGRQSEVKDRIMRGYFEEGINIGDVEELVRLGAEAGLPEAEARHALIVRSGQDGVVAAQRHATVLGITSVPSFIFDGQYTISGAQEVAIFAQVLDQVAQFASAKDTAP
jgi:predicted DsbA family dithiol-disulfide isomerase